MLVDVAPRIEASGRERIGAFMVEHLADVVGPATWWPVDRNDLFNDAVVSFLTRLEN